MGRGGGGRQMNMYIKYAEFILNSSFGPDASAGLIIIVFILFT